MNPLATVDELRHLTRDPWSDELAAATVLAVASASVRGYVGWPVSFVDNAEAVLDTDGGPLAVVPCLNLTAVHGVTVDGQPVTGWEWSAAGVIRRPGGWPSGYRRVSVRYSGGYDPPPADLVAVVAGLATRQARPPGLAGMTVGSQNVTFTADGGPGLTMTDQAVLDRYRIAAAP